MRFSLMILGLGLSISGLIALPQAFAYQGMVQVQLLTGGAPGPCQSQCERNCQTAFQNRLMQCTRSPSNTLVERCISEVGMANSLDCAANACMSEHYPDGMETVPGLYCISSCLDAQCPTERVDASNEEEVVTPPNVTQPPSPSPLPVTGPVPDTRPQQGPPPSPQQAPAPPPSPSTSASTAQWPQESSSDIQQCSEYQSQANLCCNNPASCGSQLTASQQNSYLQAARAAQASGDVAGLQQACRQAKTASLSSGNINTGFANICFSKHSACSQSCGSHLAKWQNRLSNCSGNCDRSLVEQTVSSLQGKRQSCQGYAQLESRMRSQVYASAEDASMAALCERGSSSSLSSADERNQNPGGSGFGFDPSMLRKSDSAQPQAAREEVKQEMEVCKANPNAPGCYTAPMFGEESTAYNQEGYSTTNSNDFNVAANDFGQSGYGTTFDGVGANQMQVAAAQGHAIPNGGGGGFGGGESNANRPQAGGQDLPAMLGSGVNPNILEDGMMGGSGYTQNNAGSGFEFRNRFQGLRQGSGGPQAQGKDFKGMDLKKFLPGGDRDPRRDLANISDFYPDIGPKHIDFFQRVSSRMQTLCKLKRLLDCQ